MISSSEVSGFRGIYILSRYINSFILFGFGISISYGYGNGISNGYCNFSISLKIIL
jgi:hypothetical protein